MLIRLTWMRSFVLARRTPCSRKHSQPIGPMRHTESCVHVWKRPSISEATWSVRAPWGCSVPGALDFASPTPNRATIGDINAMALYAGESVRCRSLEFEPAAEIVRELGESIERLLRTWSST